MVDASVARQCGNVTTNNSMSLQCRNVLVEIEKHDHMVVISEAIRHEWRTHASTYAWHWLADMISRNRHVAVDPTVDKALRDAVSRLSKPDREAAWKDLLLIEAALDSDQRVISRDDVMRSILHYISYDVVRIGAVHWVNPAADQCLPWIIVGAPEDSDLKLSKKLA